jgi:hypothetical protein
MVLVKLLYSTSLMNIHCKMYVLKNNSKWDLVQGGTSIEKKNFRVPLRKKPNGELSLDLFPVSEIHSWCIYALQLITSLHSFFFYKDNLVQVFMCDVRKWLAVCHHNYWNEVVVMNYG